MLVLAFVLADTEKERSRAQTEFFSKRLGEVGGAEPLCRGVCSCCDSQPCCTQFKVRLSSFHPHPPAFASPVPLGSRRTVPSREASSLFGHHLGVPASEPGSQGDGSPTAAVLGTHSKRVLGAVEERDPTAA